MANNIYTNALESGRANDSLAETLGSLANEELTRPEDAAGIAEFLDREHPWLIARADPPSRLHPLLGLFQQVESEEAFAILRDQGLPVLRATYDQWIAEDPPDMRRNDDLMFLVKIFALYAEEQDLPRIAAAARNERLRDEYLWAPVFAVYHEDHPQYHALFAILADPLPEGFAGVCLLDAANAKSRQQTGPHPFNTPAGHARLVALLRNPSEEAFSYAHSAAAALPFIDDPPRGELLALGLDHADERVQLETAWASASLGSRGGIEYLSRTCLDWRHSALAVDYLTELGELNAIPARAKNPEFMALAEMARWLAHPMEFGRPPDEISLVDHRRLNWPPAGEPREMYVIRYRYRGTDATDEGDVGVGLVGNITFALFGDTNPDMAPEEIYALHCCWEMNAEEHPQAPGEPTIAKGRALLRSAGNPGF